MNLIMLFFWLVNDVAMIWFGQSNERLSVPAFGEWDGKVGLPDYSIDFSRIREHRRQNKSRVSLGNEDEFLNRTSVNGDQSVESLKKNLPPHQQHGNTAVVSLVLHTIATAPMIL